jgi:2-polyprenyl-3-methyl-5-hydroxy-6-metoxy-1,4-benzoquinol methylase
LSYQSEEVLSGDRFEFGRNWSSFLGLLNDERIIEAETSLKKMLGVESLAGKKFLDVGSGSGLFSLAARRLGASVFSFDYDPKSVACANELKKRYFLKDLNWVIKEGSALDAGFLSGLGQFDVVYSWGVLHHTGSMWEALEKIEPLVCDGGNLFIAIYNDQQFISRFWLKIKRIYNCSVLGRGVVKMIFYPWFALQTTLSGLISALNPFVRFLSYKKERGMSIIHDWKDWLGGYPFEVAKPEELLGFYRARGFELVNMVTTNRLGCNQLVFKKKNE